MKVDSRASIARDYLEAEVEQRASHNTTEDVRTTYSFARAERLLGREYHGRFLIELLQNAADASRGDGRESKPSHVVVGITKGPALLVANHGAPMSAEVVIESLGHIGASTKAEGDAIGHKGIGFKSVLELTLTPEIYSGLQQSSPDLAVGFDPAKADERVRAASPRWDELVAEAPGFDADSQLAIPVLRFPYWIDELPPDVVDFQEQGFDTVVRLPFDERYAGRLGLDEDKWIATVREALNDVTDQILLLLGCFDEVRLQDRVGGSEEVITPEWQQERVELGKSVSREVVRVQRNGHLSSRWRLFRRTLADRPHLAGEIAVGIRVDDGAGIETVLPAVDERPSAPFHLFFPTRISSGLPFLLHAYFEVDAARTGFYRGSAEQNQGLLAELAKLTSIAVKDASKVDSLDLASLVNLVAEAGEPDDQYARNFRSDLLTLLDAVAWIPLEDEMSRSDRPADVFSAQPDLVRRTGRAFPASYIRQQTGLGLPAGRLTNSASQLVTSRRPPDAPGLWETIGLLCRPENSLPWDGSEADEGFLCLLDLLAALDVEDQHAAQELLASLRGDPRSRLIPTVGADTGRTLLPIPDPSERIVGQRSQLIMARVRSSAGPNLVPPKDLDVAFLPDGLLSSEAELDRARPLGVRPFTVDNVLNRLSGIEDSNVDGDKLVRFLWQLLARERVSAFSTRRCAERASVFDPSRWFWCRPGRAREDETARLRQQRARYLAAVPLPCRDGVWRQAGRIAFGSDWADWLEEHADEDARLATQHRISAYRAMEQVSPGPEALLAPPNVVLEMLSEDVFHDASSVGSAGTSDEQAYDEEAEDTPDERQRDAERHAFLLTLGVWEVPPIEAYESRDPRNREKFPGKDQAAEKQVQMIEQDGGWQFGLNGWAGNRHHNVYLGEDYRFLWPLAEMAQRSASDLVTGLSLGAKLYGERTTAFVFCPGCRNGNGSHTAARHSSSADGYPSSLAVQLKNDQWVPCTLDGDPVEVPATPQSAWWHPKPPSGSRLRQSPWRLVPICGPDEGINEDLRRLAGIHSLDDASVGVVEQLLVGLRERFENSRLPVDPYNSGIAWQVFTGLHRLAYERLAELTQEDPQATAALDRTGVLCTRGERLEYRPAAEARHDDGRFSTYARHFVGSIPLIVLPRDREAVASRLEITPFRLTLTRRNNEDGRDVTDEVRDMHTERIAELLSIMVHHSLGTQTLEVTGQQFEERARRIRNLRVKQLDDLVVDAVAEGSDKRVTLGEGSTQDLFLENPYSVSPVLFHDLSGDGWQDRLRRKIAPYLATVLENQAYAHTFELFLQRDNETEREEFLLELGISADEVDAIAARIGVVRAEERRRHALWFRSILEELNTDSSELDLDAGHLASRLKEAGLNTQVVDRLVELGGGEASRRETGEDSALWLLDQAGVDLHNLDSRLRSAGDPGLDIRLAQKKFFRWLDANGRRLSAVLATVMSPDEAKTIVRSLEPPPALRLSLDPALPDLLSPAVRVLRDAGLEADAESLANRPPIALTRIGGLDTVNELDEKVLLVFDEEEQARFLRTRAAQWSEEIRLLAVLARTGPADTRANIRETYEIVTTKLPDNPSSPTELRDALYELLGGHPTLAEHVSEHLEESVAVAAPNRKELLAWAQQDGIATGHLDLVQRARDVPRGDYVRALKERSEQLAHQNVRPIPPPALRKVLAGPPPTESTGSTQPQPKPIKAIKVGEGRDRRKRELGEEGEQWALAAVVGDLTELDDESRDAAIEEIVTLFGWFEGTPVDQALSHAVRARMKGLDEEERVEELTGLLHVASYSDAFGFDLIGWLPQSSNGKGRAVCLEVKSSGSEGFHLSRNEWSVAERLHNEGIGDQYAVLVVRRARGGGIPAAMDLLSDPVSLVEAGLLRREVDGYQIAYRTSDV